MHKLITFSAASAMLFALTGLPATAATAPPVNKTWVSSTGSDTGSCQLVAPCKSFAYAISETNAGGEIDVKDLGAFGAFTINKAISIIADGVVASVGVGTNSVGIYIAAGNTDNISIRGLTVNTHLSGNGIEIISASHVTLDHLIIQENKDGIIEQNVYMTVSNCLINDNQTDGIYASQIGQRPYLFDDIITDNYNGVDGYFNTEGNNIIKNNLHVDYGDAVKVNPD